MMLLMSNLGFRVSEVINLRWDDVDLNCGNVVIRNGKGGKDRTLWADKPSWKPSGRGESGKDGPTPVLRSQRSSESPWMLGTSERWSRLSVKAGIAKDVHPHTAAAHLRHAWYEQNRDIRRLQEILGHADISTKQIYAHVSGADIKEGMQGFSAGIAPRR